MKPSFRRCSHVLPRRAALCLAGIAAASPAHAFFGRNPTLLPHNGDRLVTDPHAADPAMLGPVDVQANHPPIRAWIYDPTNRAVRDPSLFGQVLLVRLDPETLSSREQSLAVDGIVAYTAICTHAGCVVVGWDSAAQHFQCPCHGSVFDAADCGRVVAGPAPRPLPALPLHVVDKHLAIAGSFTAPIGGSTGRTD
jgi:rieske iron-sulfur protein